MILIKYLFSNAKACVLIRLLSVDPHISSTSVSNNNKSRAKERSKVLLFLLKNKNMLMVKPFNLSFHTE